MIFQLLDSKEECYKIFCAGGLHEDYSDEVLTHTWSPSLSLEGRDIEYAQIWCQGKSLLEVSQENNKNRYKLLNEKAKVFLKTFHSAMINLDDVCFYDSVPEKFLLDFYDLKTQITQDVFESCQKPKNHDFMRDLILFLKKIESRELNIDFDEANSFEEKKGSAKLSSNKTRIVYNPWGTVTGRLTTEKNSFPILTLNKELRSCIRPRNDLFIELDYNAAELRVLLGLLDHPQPAEDIHAWLAKSVFEDKYTRDEVKKKVFAWLYNPKSKNKKLNQIFDRQRVLQKYYDGKHVVTPFGRVIEAPEEKALNYLIQSTSSDMMLTSAMKLDKILKNKKSFVSFCIHDSIVLDISAEDRRAVEQLEKEFSSGLFGGLKTNISLGTDFGNMKGVE